MKALAAVAWTLTLGAVVDAHHSYTAFDRTRSVTLSGTVDRFRVANPHTVFDLRLDDGRIVLVTWASASQLAYTSIDAKTLGAGERLEVTGSPALDLGRHELTLVSRVVRTRDGWTWAKVDGRISVTGPPAHAGH